MTHGSVTEQAETHPPGHAARPYSAARSLSRLPFDLATSRLRGALAVAPADPDLNAIELWLALHRHRAGQETIDRVNRTLASVRLLDRPISADNAFEACLLARQAANRQDDPARFFRYAAISHASGMIAFWAQYGQALTVEHRRDRYLLRVGDRRLVFGIDGEQLEQHFDFFFVHEPGMWEWFAGFSADDVLLDVGANVGLYSVGAAALSGCAVVGLEPFPVNLAAAAANIEANGLGDRVRMLPVAAAALSGNGVLRHDKAIPGMAEQSFHAAGEAVGRSAGMAVEGVAIDDLVERREMPFPTRIKIDVDGGEDAVVAGMQRTLADPRLRDVRMEVRWWRPGKKEVVDAVTRHGFRAQAADDKKNLLFRRVPSTGTRG